jgi:hypothetical protein
MMDELWEKCIEDKFSLLFHHSWCKIISKLQPGCAIPGSGFRCFWNNISKTLFHMSSEVAKKYKM